MTTVNKINCDEMTTNSEGRLAAEALDKCEGGADALSVTAEPRHLYQRERQDTAELTDKCGGGIDKQCECYSKILARCGELLLQEVRSERPDTKYSRDLTTILREISALRREAMNERIDGQLSVRFLNTEGAEA